ncbi:hypothetical protein [Paenibacillus polymyxa]|nr:hypothetical protein [Paenibacillus polymyxa]
MMTNKVMSALVSLNMVALPFTSNYNHLQNMTFVDTCRFSAASRPN